MHIATTLEELANKFKKSKTEIENILKTADLKLLQVRSKRPKLHCDDKIIVGLERLDDIRR